MVLLLVLIPLIVDSFPVDQRTTPGLVSVSYVDPLDLVSVSHVDPFDGIPVPVDLWVKLTRNERIAELEAEIVTQKYRIHLAPRGNTTATDNSSASQEERIAKLEAELAALKRGESLDADNKAIWVAGDDYQCGLEAPSPETWEKYNVTAWLEEQLKDNKGHFYNNLVKKYAPDAALSLANCDGKQTCSIGSCQVLSRHFSREEIQRAYIALETMANFNQFNMILQDTADAAQMRVNTWQPSFATDFTEAGLLKAEHTRRQKQKQLILHSILLGVLVSTSVVSAFVGGPLAAGAASAAGSAALNGVKAAQPVLFGAKHVIPLGSRLAANPIGLASGVTGSAYAGGAAIALDFQKSMDFFGDQEADFARFFGRFTATIHDGIVARGQALFRGENLSDGSNIITILESGIFAQPSIERTLRLENQLDKFMMGTAINYYWAGHHAYIVESDAPWGCENDGRGPHEVKVCLPEESKKVYHIYHISRAKDHTKGKGQPRGPPGYLRLTGDPFAYGGITLQDVVRSSVAHYRDHGFAGVDETAVVTDPLNYFRNGTEVHRMGGPMAGMFTVPIAVNPGGEAISAIGYDSKVTRGRNYPCMVGDLRWDGKDYDQSRDESFRFIMATDNWEDEDFMEYCDDGKYMNCDTQKHWNGKKINDFPIPPEIASKWLFKKRPFVQWAEDPFHSNQKDKGTYRGGG
ncbi:hypothetical protein H2199_003601 [Coniosporium tulheliwenetii]|uniref:Uncharacterized protein n=1 Tax=Coniosporium tulheliwenetii TaxID=3383036 RepID=A0ACC2ZA56_9PEZI|nr:hypothetical protein H2199_003601 [Cladosporium sp. JES 115]